VSFFWKAAGVGALALIITGVTSAYLQPGMLVEFANLVLCL